MAQAKAAIERGRRKVLSVAPTPRSKVVKGALPDPAPGVPQFQGQQGSDPPRSDDKYRRSNVGGG